MVVKAFGDMGQTAWLRLIRDRFIAGHNSCELSRHLDSVPPEMPIQDIVDRCWVWESHADSDVQRGSKPGPDTVFSTNAVSDSDGRVDDLCVAAVATPQSTPDQANTAAAPAPTRKPEPPAVDQLPQRLVAETRGSAACTGGGDRIGEIGNFASKFPFCESGPSTAILIGTHSTGLECGSVFFLWQGGP